MRGAAPLLPAILVLLLTALPQAQEPAPLTLLSRDGRRVIPSTMSGGREFVALDDIVSLFQVTVREEALTGGLTVAHQGRSIIVSTSQPLASVNGRAVALSAPAMRTGNRWSVPIDFLSSGLSLIYDQRIEVRRAARLVVVGDLRVPRVTARIDAVGPPARATIEISPATRASITTETGRLVIRLDADALDPTFPGDGTGLIEQIRLGDQPGTIAVVLADGAGQGRAVAADVGGMTRINIDVAPDVPPPDTALLRTAPAGVPPLPPTRTRSPISTIVIDPGHGGDDVGARGRSGTEEKTLTLAVAQRVKALIEMRLGIRVILTRTADRRVSLSERAAVANNNKADLFLSLHLNAAPTAASTGAEVLGLRLDQQAADVRRVAGGEMTLPVFGGVTRSVDVIRWDLAQVRHTDASTAFARILEDQLRARVTMSARPRRAIPLRLLTSVNMPAALIEMAYLTNPGQERTVRSDTFQADIAQAILGAVQQFRSYLEERSAP